MDKRLKKLLAGATSVALVASQTLIGFVYGASYPQVVQEAFQWAKQNGMTNANTIEEFEPYAQLSRGTAAKLFAIFGKNVLGLQPDPNRSCNFSDIEGKWYAKYAIEACQLGLMKGNNGKFEGDRLLYKSEAVVVLARALAGKTLEWNEAITYAQEKGITHETDVTKLYRPVLKWELVIMMKRVADMKKAEQPAQGQQTEETADIAQLLGSLLGEETTEGQTTQGQTTQEQTTSEETTTEEQTQEGQTTEETTQEETTEEQTAEENVLEVALDPESPNNITVPYNAYHQPVMIVDFTAGEKDVTVDSVKFLRRGVGKAEDFERLALYVDGRRVSDWNVVSSYDDSLVFNRVDLVVPAGKTIKVVLVADFAGNQNVANHQNYFVLTDVNASAPVRGLPVQGGIINIVNVNLLSAKYTLLALPTKIGRIGDYLVMARVKLEAPASDPVALESITFVNNGTIDAQDLADFDLYINGEKVGSAKSMYTVRGDDLVTIKLDKPYRIDKGASRIIELKGHIIGGRSNDTIVFDLDDMFLRNLTYDVGNGYVYNATASASIEDRTITLRAAKLEIIPHPLTELYKKAQVQIGANDVVFARFDMNVSSDVQIKGLKVEFTLSGQTLKSYEPEIRAVTLSGVGNKVSAEIKSDFYTVLFDRDTDVFTGVKAISTYTGIIVFTGNKKVADDYFTGPELGKIKFYIGKTVRGYILKGTYGLPNGVTITDPLLEYAVVDGTGANAHLYYAKVCSKTSPDVCYTFDRDVMNLNVEDTMVAWCKNDVAALTNIRLIDQTNDKVLLSTSINCANLQNSEENYASLLIDFNDSVFDLSKGQHKLAVVANIPVARDDLDGKTIRSKLLHPRYWTYVRDLVTGKKFNPDDQNEVIPGSDVVFTPLTLSLPYIYVGPKAFTRPDLVAGATDYVLAKYIVTLKNIGNIKLYSPEFRVYSSLDGTTLDKEFTKNVVLSVDLYVNGEKVATDSPDSEGLVHFDGAFGDLSADDSTKSTAILELRAHITNDTTQLSKVKALVTAVNYLESDDNYGNAYVLSPTRIDPPYIKGGTDVKVLLIKDYIKKEPITTINELKTIDPVLYAAIVVPEKNIHVAGKLAITTDATDTEYNYRFMVADGETLNKVMKISLGANYEDFNVTTIKGVVNKGANAVDSIKLIDNGNVVAVAYPDVNGNFTFDNLDLTVSANDTKDLEVAVVVQNGKNAKIAGTNIQLDITEVKGVGKVTGKLVEDKTKTSSNTYVAAVGFPSALTVEDLNGINNQTVFKFSLTNGGKRDIVLVAGKGAITFDLSTVGVQSGDYITGLYLALSDGTQISNKVDVKMSGDNLLYISTDGGTTWTQTNTITLIVNKDITLSPAESNTFLIKTDSYYIKGESDNNIDKVELKATFKRNNAVTFRDGAKQDAYGVGGLKGVNLTVDSVTAVNTLK